MAKDIMKWGNIICYLAMILINILANVLPLGGHTTGQISAAYPNLFTPAPYTFSIWGVIYLLIGVFAFYQPGKAANVSTLPSLAALIAPWFMISCLMNILWILFWHNDQIGISVLCMIGLLLSLIVINRKLTSIPSPSLWDCLSIYGFELYLGWICAASIANISVFLVKADWKHFGLPEEFWTVLVILIGAIIGIGFLYFGHRYFSTLAIIWAYVGILVRHLGKSGYHAGYPLVIAILILAITAMIILLLINIPLIKKKKTHIPNTSPMSKS